jgi:hypothetical protein
MINKNNHEMKESSLKKGREVARRFEVIGSNLEWTKFSVSHSNIIATRRRKGDLRFALMREIIKMPSKFISYCRGMCLGGIIWNFIKIFLLQNNFFHFLHEEVSATLEKRDENNSIEITRPKTSH